MIFRSFIIFLTFIWATSVFGQTRTLTGKVVNQDLQPFYGVKFFNTDTTLLATSDTNGHFILTISSNAKSLLVAAIGMEWKSLELFDNCINVEVILLTSSTYDFMTAGKIDRIRKKEFDKLPALHKTAFEKGIFKTKQPCYVDKFISIKKRLKEIHKNRT